MNYAIFRSEPIYTLNDLAQIGSHNKREKKAYQSNPDIDITKSKDNIELVPLAEKYLKGFDNLTKEYPNMRLMYSEGIYFPCFDYLDYLDRVLKKLVFTPSSEKLKFVKSIRIYDVEKMRKIIKFAKYIRI